MHLVEHLHGHSWIHRVDPRFRVVGGFVLAGLVAVSRSWPVVLAGLGMAVVLLALARIGLHVLKGRLSELNLFMLLVLAFVPFSIPGRPLFLLGPWAFSREGALFGLLIAAKGNVIVLLLTALVSTIETVSLGHALWHLKVPVKLVHLFMMTVRYIDVLHHEYLRLRLAMRARCFKPRLNGHTLRTLGNLVGILLVRSVDRSERIMAAMKCRGFKGEFWMLDHFAAGPRDVLFGSLAALAAAGLVWMERL